MPASSVPRIVVVIAGPGWRSSWLREVHAVDEDLLEVRVSGQRDVLDAAGDVLGPRALGLGQQRQLGAERGGVADVADALARQVGDEADAHGAVDREIVAEAAGQ